MRTTLIACAAILATFAFSAPSHAGVVNDIYISFSNFGDGGAAGNTMAELQVGQSGSAYIWVNDTYSIDTGAFMDVFNDNTGAIRFTASEVFNPDILLLGDPFDSRWQPPNDEGENPGFDGGTVSDGLIDEMRGFRVNIGRGILPSQTTGNPLEDVLHDPSSNAFLFARIDFEAVGAGTSNFSLGIGDGLIVNDGQELQPFFGEASVNVVPEPTSTGLMVIGLIAMGIRRRR